MSTKSENVRAFNDEISSIMDSKPPISRSKMSNITKLALKGIYDYKHIVQIIEKFIQKSRNEYKIPGLYILDAVIRQSRFQYGDDNDVYAPRFTKNLDSTIKNIVKHCSEDDKGRVIRILNMWQKNNLLMEDIVQPMLDLVANPKDATLMTNIRKAIEKQPPGPSITAVLKMKNKLDKAKKEKHRVIVQELPPEPEEEDDDVMKVVMSKVKTDSHKHHERNRDSQKESLFTSVAKEHRASTPEVFQSPIVKTVHVSPKCKEKSNIKSYSRQLEVEDVAPPIEDPLPPPPPPGPPPSQQADKFEFNKKLLDFDYGESDDDIGNTPNAINNTATSSITAGLVPLMPAVPVAVPPPHPSAIVHPAALVNRLFQMQTSLPPPPPQGVPLPSMQGMPPSMQGMPPHGGPGYPGFQASGFNWNNTQRFGIPPIMNQMPPILPPETSDADMSEVAMTIDDDTDDDCKVIEIDPSQDGMGRIDVDSMQRFRQLSPRSEKYERDELDKQRRREGWPPTRDDYISICTRTLWFGHLNKNIEEYMLDEEIGYFGKIDSIKFIRPRGCAFVVMNLRKDAFSVMSNMKGCRILGNSIKIAWAPNTGVKEADLVMKDWCVDTGVTYVRRHQYKDANQLRSLAEGGVLDERTLPRHIKNEIETPKPIKPPTLPPPSLAAPPSSLTTPILPPTPSILGLPSQPQQQQRHPHQPMQAPLPNFSPDPSKLMNQEGIKKLMDGLITNQSLPGILPVNAILGQNNLPRNILQQRNPIEMQGSRPPFVNPENIRQPLLPPFDTTQNRFPNMNQMLRPPMNISGQRLPQFQGHPAHQPIGQQTMFPGPPPPSQHHQQHQLQPPMQHQLAGQMQALRSGGQAPPLMNMAPPTPASLVGMQTMNAAAQMNNFNTALTTDNLSRGPPPPHPHQHPASNINQSLLQMNAIDAEKKGILGKPPIPQLNMMLANSAGLMPNKPPPPMLIMNTRPLGDNNMASSGVIRPPIKMINYPPPGIPLPGQNSPLKTPIGDSLKETIGLMSANANKDTNEDRWTNAINMKDCDPRNNGSGDNNSIGGGGASRFDSPTKRPGDRFEEGRNRDRFDGGGRNRDNRYDSGSRNRDDRYADSSRNRDGATSRFDSPATNRNSRDNNRFDGGRGGGGEGRYRDTNRFEGGGGGGRDYGNDRHDSGRYNRSRDNNSNRNSDTRERRNRWDSGEGSAAAGGGGGISRQEESPRNVRDRRDSRRDDRRDRRRDDRDDNRRSDREDNRRDDRDENRGRVRDSRDDVDKRDTKDDTERSQEKYDEDSKMTTEDSRVNKRRTDSDEMRSQNDDKQGSALGLDIQKEKKSDVSEEKKMRHFSSNDEQESTDNKPTPDAVNHKDSELAISSDDKRVEAGGDNSVQRDDNKDDIDDKKESDWINNIIDSIGAETPSDNDSECIIKSNETSPEFIEISKTQSGNTMDKEPMACETIENNDNNMDKEPIECENIENNENDETKDQNEEV